MTPRHPTWDVWQTFLAVMKTGSLSAAGRSLNLAQPTVRRHIEGLEAMLGSVLFTRDAQGLTPTDADRNALSFTDEMEASANSASRRLSAPKSAVAGRIRLTASLIMASEVLPPILHALREKHPGLDIELSATNELEDLRRRDADVAVRLTAPRQAGLVARKLGSIGLGLFASSSYARVHCIPRRPADLTKDHVLIGEDRGTMLGTALTKTGINADAARFAMRTDNDAVQLALLRAGAGIGVCQVLIALREPKLVRVLPRIGAQMDLWLVMHEDLRADLRIRAVFDHLVTSLSKYAARRS
jgi:DNA-binding transcriptional LysR family regulator